MRIVVGIPTRNEAATIQHVTAVVDAGLAASFPTGDCWIVNADNASADGTQSLFLAAETRARKHAIDTGGTGTGKGTNVLAVLGFARSVGADCVVFLDGDLRSAQPEWIGTFVAHATSSTDPTFVTPRYTRNRYEANTTNQLVRPYLQAAFGLDIAQPIGGEFAMNAAFVDIALGWDRYESTHLYGIDVWLTVNAALHGCRIEQISIGRKLHNPTFPKIYRLGEQVLDTLYRLMIPRRPARPVYSTPQSTERSVDEHATRLPDALVQPVLDVHRRYVTDHRHELLAWFPALADVRWDQDVPALTTPIWAQLLAEAYLALTPENLPVIRDHVVGLFPARVVTYWQEIEDLGHHDVEALLHQQNNLVAGHLDGGWPLPPQPAADRPSVAAAGA